MTATYKNVTKYCLWWARALWAPLDSSMMKNLFSNAYYYKGKKNPKTKQNGLIYLENPRMGRCFRDTLI